MVEGQKNIYYASADNKDKVLALPQMESLKNKGYDVLVLTDNVDEFMIQVLREYDKVEFKNINSSDLDLLSDDEKKDIEKAKEDNKDLLTSIKEALPDVKDVVISTHLTDSACCLSSGEGISFEMEKVLNSQQGDNKVKAERILEINSNSELFKLIQESYKESKDSVKDYSKLLYDEALINQGLPLENPREFSNLLENLMKKSLSK
jgi:molecular chaperone HtpG